MSGSDIKSSVEDDDDDDVPVRVLRSPSGTEETLGRYQVMQLNQIKGVGYFMAVG